MHHHYTGLASEFFVAAYLANNGHDVFFPSMPTRADLPYIKEEKSVRVQVKTTIRVSTPPYLYEQCRLTNRQGIGYTSKDIDELWVVGMNLWRFPIDRIEGLTSLSLCNNGPTNGYKKKNEYDPENHVVISGTWENPVRNFFA